MNPTENLYNALLAGETVVKYSKKDGSERIIVAKFENGETEANVEDPYYIVHDTEANDWRTINVKTVSEFHSL